MIPDTQAPVPIGKTVGQKTYLHVDSLDGRSGTGALAQRVAAAEALVGLRRGDDFNLVRVDAETGELALLHYPSFFDEAFPALAASWRVDLADGSVTYRTYADSLNPPILHRKELLLPSDHPRREEYAALTAAAESIGLFEDTTRIGYRRQWQALVRAKGYRIDGHALLPLGNDETDDQETAAGEDTPLHAGWQAARHRTAMVRYGFSAPVQSLARHGFLDGQYRLFDYGCGRGDDVRGLRENGLDASGWDPYYAPENPITAADLVNLGFVINVIEDFDERLEALQRAWSLAERLLVVSVMLANQSDPRGERFRDGVMTQRRTFQKYYTQHEIKHFLSDALDEEPIPVAPGVLYVFRDKDAEQRFLVERYRSRRSRLRDPSVPARAPGISKRRDRRAEQYAACQEPLEHLWDLWLGLGRRPEKADLASDDLLALCEGFGTLNQALRFLDAVQRERLGDEEASRLLDRAERERVADLEVYFALQQFDRRRPYKHLEAGLQRDIKAFFGDYQGACTTGFARLLQIGDVDAIAAACQEAAEHGLGWLEREDAGVAAGAEEETEADSRPRGLLTLHTGLIEQLPALLRVYIGAAAALYGDVHNADLIKVHIGSGKLTLMRFDDFDGRALPRMLERVKIKMRAQDVDVFEYGERFEPPFLYRKSRFMNEEHPGYPDQVAFDEGLVALEARGLFDLSGYGPSAAELLAILERHRWEVDGLRLQRVKTPSELDDPCGQFLRFRDLIECGETWHRLAGEGGFDNRPRQPESYTALLELAEQVLDPVIDWFGMVELTYGFCSPALARQIPGRIDPKRDQHAAHERNRLGNPVCQRLGAAVDFIIADEDMLEVARWLAMNTPFDRLYFYGADKPIHVSYGPEHSRQVVTMRPGPSGRLVPRAFSVEAFSQARL